MKNPDENKIDRLFRDGLTRPDQEPDFKEEHWSDMEELLDEKQDHKKGIFWLYWVSGMAALLLLFLGWYFLMPRKSPDGQVSRNKAKPAQFQKPNYDNPKAKDIPKANENNITHAGTSLKHENTTRITAIKHKRQKNSLGLTAKANTFYPPTTDSGSISNNEIANVDGLHFTAESSWKLVSVLPITASTLTKIEDKKHKNKPKLKLPVQSRLSLAVLTAPDLNGVGSFGQSKVGTNGGIQLSIRLSNRWSITTGAVYAVKPYAIGLSQNGAYANAALATAVDANCKVLDIPVNINYKFFSKGKNALSAGTGLSSYLMLREHYRFIYTDNTYWDYNISNRNQHPFSVLNLNATYERKVNSRFGIIVQPYMKLPLTNIGQERVNLQSTGVAVGVDWNINPFRKPK